MIKRIVTLLVAASIISAGLLSMGVAVLRKFSPASASSMDALVAAPAVQDAVVSTLTDSEFVPRAKVSSTWAGDTRRLQVSVNSAVGEAQAAGITIGELLTNPAQYKDQVFTLTGVATRLGAGRFLLNDGTGQILVEVDDDSLASAALDGQSITVTGEFDDALKLEACTLTDQQGTITIDDCLDDSSTDDDAFAGDDDLDDDADDLDDDVDDDTDDLDDDADDLDDDVDDDTDDLDDDADDLDDDVDDDTDDLDDDADDLDDDVDDDTDDLDDDADDLDDDDDGDDD